LPSVNLADLRKGEALPRAAERLGGMPQTHPAEDTTLQLCCPECGVYYRYQIESAKGEHKLALTRMLPGEMRVAGLIWRWRYKRLIRELSAAFEIAESDDMQLYLARSLARHHLDGKDAVEFASLCQHESWAVRRQAVLQISSEEMGPHIDQLISMLFDHAKVADAAKVPFQIYTDQSPELLKYGTQLVAAFAQHPMSQQGVAFLQHLTRHYLDQIDITPCVPRVLELWLAERDNEHLLVEARHVLTRFVRHCTANADSFLMIFADFELRHTCATLKEVAQDAKVELGQLR